MKELIKIQDAPNLLKNPETGSFINVDEAAYRSALARKRSRAEAAELRDRVEALERRVAELEALLISDK
jgi:uncharacterized protein YceH (UPF0502 family)